MKLRYKIMLGFLGLIAVGIGALAVALSYTADCPEPPALAAGTETMQAIRARCYGSPDVLALESVEKPEPGPGEILIKVKAAAVNPLDYHFMRGSPYVLRAMAGLGKPDDPRSGVDFSGVVDAVGEGVTKFAVGDAVFGGANGAFAEYVIRNEDGAVVKKPENVTFEQAASIAIAGATAVQALKDLGKVEPGQSVLINGASGGVGTFAVQIAKDIGATVSGVCSTRNVELVKALGADRVYDYKKESYMDSDERFDLIVDMVGNYTPSANHKMLKPGGRLVLVGGPKGKWLAPFKRPLQAMWTSWFVDEEMLTLFATIEADDLEYIADLMEAGDLVPQLDQTYALAEVPDAIRYSESGRARGKIIIDVDLPEVEEPAPEDAGSAEEPATASETET